MKTPHPLFDSTTIYWIEVQGRLDANWLQSFEDSVKVTIEERGQMEALTVIQLQTDQSGVVGLVRRLHGLGMTILRLQVISAGGKAGEVGLES